MTTNVGERADDHQYATWDGAYVLGALSEAERKEYGAHMAGCEPCRTAVAELNHIPALLSLLDADEVMALDEDLPKPPPVRSEVVVSLAAAVSRKRRRSRMVATVVSAAAAVVVAAGSLSIGLGLRPAQPPSAVEQVFASPDVRAVSDAIRGGGTATVVFSRQKETAVMIMDNLTAPPPSTVYQMWRMGAQGPKPAGTFSTQVGTLSATAVLSNLDNAAALALTIEPGAGSNQPTGDPIAELPLT